MKAFVCVFSFESEKLGTFKIKKAYRKMGEIELIVQTTKLLLYLVLDGLKKCIFLSY